MTMFEWFDAQRASDTGNLLADFFAAQAVVSGPAGGKPGGSSHDMVRDLILRASDEARELRLNLYKRTQLAKAFRWRLVSLGVERAFAHRVARELVIHLWMNRRKSAWSGASRGPVAVRRTREEALFLLGNEMLGRGDRVHAISCYQEAIKFNPGLAAAYNNLGCALIGLGRLKEAETHFAKAVELEPNFAEAHTDLGNLYRERGLIAQSEISLRKALKIKPKYVPALINLGLTTSLLGQSKEARSCLEKALKIEPRNPVALVEMGNLLGREGKFAEAETHFKRALAIDANLCNAVAAIMANRKMTTADEEWPKRAKELIQNGVEPVDELKLRYAMGKYFDDIGDYDRAFENFQRANALRKQTSEPYDPVRRTRFVDDMIRVYDQARVLQVQSGSSSSERPVLIVGMMRSGTSLAEQIIASHPSAAGAGELAFWGDAFQKHGQQIRKGESLSPSELAELGQAYLTVLSGYSSDALRVVDKAPINSDYLGLIHSVFPQARIIYMQRDPIDTCLSCYFQSFSADFNFTVDLAHLAQFYREHHRLIAHWRAVLPPSSFLDVPYEALVSDPEQWSRRMIDFIGLPWDARCLNFHKTDRVVTTASQWQVRQKIYNSSVARWRHYEKYIAPLKGLEKLA
ncbi:MAG: sulfotransferase [Burkholderiaceae bacterium]|jgi:tetratricopeptide (TPR) repeat protein